jgi:nicotinamidase/pyrazinamidase
MTIKTSPAFPRSTKRHGAYPIQEEVNPMDAFNPERLQLSSKDALMVIDVQNDFLPGGRMAVPLGDEVISPLNQYIRTFYELNLPIIAVRDWHPQGHCSFRDRGGRWPSHCVQNTPGAQFCPRLRLPSSAILVSKGTSPHRDSLSGFEWTNLDDRLHLWGIQCLFIGGLALEYSVFNTVKDALTAGYTVYLLNDATRPLNARDGVRALEDMLRLGVVPVELETAMA